MVFNHHVSYDPYMYHTKTCWNGRLATLVHGYNIAHTPSYIGISMVHVSKVSIVTEPYLSAAMFNACRREGKQRCYRVVMFLIYIEQLEKCVANSQMKHILNYINYTQNKTWMLYRAVFLNGRKWILEFSIQFYSEFCYCLKFLTWTICRKSLNQVFDWQLIYDHSHAWLTCGSKLCICSVFVLISIFFIPLFVIIYMITNSKHSSRASDKNKLNICVFGLL